MSYATAPISQEHPLDVLTAYADWQTSGRHAALIMLTRAMGGAVRAPGALMAVSDEGDRFGYLSGGCIDADIALHAETSLKTGEIRTLRYGTRSPFLDIKLPCGGAIDVTVFPNPDRSNVIKAIESLQARKRVNFKLGDTTQLYTAHYRPKLRLRVVGRGHDPLVLARIAISSGIMTELWSNESDCLAAAEAITGLSKLTALTVPDQLPAVTDDAETGFVLMMHDPDWEPPVLASALAGDAFYIGAVGSPRTHARRCAALSSIGVSDTDIARIHGPIGLVPSLRDASMLAISTLAEIISAYQTQSDTLSITSLESVLTDG